MAEQFKFDTYSGVRSGWNIGHMAIRGKLTDRKIAYYMKRGWYSKELKQTRRELMEKKASKRSKRVGQFVKSDDGRLIYDPL